MIIATLIRICLKNRLNKATAFYKIKLFLNEMKVLEYWSLLVIMLYIYLYIYMYIFFSG